MAPVKVIVQGIPVQHCDFSCSFPSCSGSSKRRKFTHRNATILEQLFANYGPVNCSYLWSNEKMRESSWKSRVKDNFAHLIFENTEDASKACEASGKHEIILNNSLLMCTAVPDDCTLIDILNDYCLMTIFSMLELHEKFVVEKVCQRWQNLARSSWRSTRILDLMTVQYNEKELNAFLIKCGMYLDEVICRISSSKDCNLISDAAYFKNVKTITLDIWSHLWSSASLLFRELQQLKIVTLRVRFGSVYLPVSNYLAYLPESVEKLSIESIGQAEFTGYFDVSRFRHLQSLTMIGCELNATFLRGMEYMENLVHLDFNNSFNIHFPHIKKIKNFTKIKTLKISKSRIDDHILKDILLNHRGLECLDVSYIPQLTDYSVALVSTLPNMKTLNISGLPHVQLNYLHGMSSLENLNCQLCSKIKNEALINLIRMAPNLSYLNVSNCPITSQLLVVANSIVKQRDNDILLGIVCDLSEAENNIQNLSPLLKIYYPLRDLSFDNLYHDNDPNDNVDDDSDYY